MASSLRKLRPTRNLLSNRSPSKRVFTFHLSGSEDESRQNEDSTTEKPTEIPEKEVPSEIVNEENPSEDTNEENPSKDTNEENPSKDTNEENPSKDTNEENPSKDTNEENLSEVANKKKPSNKKHRQLMSERIPSQQPFTYQLSDSKLSEKEELPTNLPSASTPGERIVTRSQSTLKKISSEYPIIKLHKLASITPITNAKKKPVARRLIESYFTPSTALVADDSETRIAEVEPNIDKSKKQSIPNEEVASVEENLAESNNQDIAPEEVPSEADERIPEIPHESPRDNESVMLTPRTRSQRLSPLNVSVHRLRKSVRLLSPSRSSREKSITPSIAKSPVIVTLRGKDRPLTIPNRLSETDSRLQMIDDILKQSTITPEAFDSLTKIAIRPEKRKFFAISEESMQALKKRKVSRPIFEVKTDTGKRNPFSVPVARKKPSPRTNPSSQEDMMVFMKKSVLVKRPPSDVTDVEVGITKMCELFETVIKASDDPELNDFLKKMQENVVQEVSEILSKVVELKGNQKEMKQLRSEIKSCSIALGRTVDEAAKRREPQGAS